MTTSVRFVLTIENGVGRTGGGASVRAAGAQAEAPRSGRGGSRFSKKIGGHPRALIGAPPAVMLGLSRRASSPLAASDIASIALPQTDGERRGRPPLPLYGRIRRRAFSAPAGRRGRQNG